MVSVVVAISVLDTVLAEIRPSPSRAFVGIVKPSLKDPESDALNDSMTPPL
jgi:hypothetical protein